MMLFYSILFPFLIGFLFCFALLKEIENPNLRFIANLGFPIGIGLSSLIFIFFNLLGFSTVFSTCIEICILFYLLYKIKNLKQKLFQFEWFNFNNIIKSPILMLAIIIYFYYWLLCAGIFFFESVKEPHGIFDAWGNWNLGARFISRDPLTWSKLFNEMFAGYFHTDYPLLQKSFIARCWIISKNETVWVPITFAFIFTFCTIGLLTSAVASISNKLTGLMAGLILLATPSFMCIGYSQYADSTIGFFYLATIILLSIARSGTRKPLLLILAGLTAGLSTWSKNEGLIFIACLLISELTSLLYKNLNELKHDFKFILIGFLPVFLFVIYFKLSISPPNELFLDQTASSYLDRLLDPKRYVTVCNIFIDMLRSFGRWDLNPWWIFLFGILYKGVNFNQNRNVIFYNFTFIVLFLIALFFVYILTPMDLIWHLNTSLHRLLFQLFPAFIFIYFFTINNNRTKSAK